MPEDKYPKSEVKAIEEITGTDQLISEYSERGYADFKKLWRIELLARTNNSFPKAPVKKGILEECTNALYSILGGTVEFEKVKPERMSYDEKLVYIDLAHDVVAATESTLKWKLDSEDIPEIRPDSKLEGDLGLTTSTEFDILRGSMKKEYITPHVSRKIRKKTMAELVEKVAEHYAKLRSS